MITKVRPTITGRQFGRSSPTVDPITRNAGAKSLILTELDEKLTENILSQKHAEISLKIRLTPQGIEEYIFLEGDTKRVA